MCLVVLRLRASQPQSHHHPYGPQSLLEEYSPPLVKMECFLLFHQKQEVAIIAHKITNYYTHHSTPALLDQFRKHCGAMIGVWSMVQQSYAQTMLMPTMLG